ncbi:hypothetical protein DFQ30_000329 [Apophysomyces sp. BC1015]|nr:hypothetical protein DFQ30_000329 [Apophysomyces sp. BC1015]
MGVGRILQVGTLDDAVEYVLALPASMQKAPVWNQLLSHCAQKGKAQKAEQFWAMMRKKGVLPTERTFSHLMTALSKCDSPDLVTRAEEWMKRIEDYDVKPNVHHMNILLGIYHRKDLPDKVIDTLNLMKEKQMHPDRFSYTLAFYSCPKMVKRNGIDEVRRLWSEIEQRLEPTNPSVRINSSLARKAAAIATTEDAIRTPVEPFKIDSKVVCAFLFGLTRTARQDNDIWLGLNAIDRLYSLRPAKVEEMMVTFKGFRDLPRGELGYEPTIEVLDAILRFCGGLGQFKLASDYYYLTLKNYRKLEPDQRVYESMSWIERENKKSRPRKPFRL